MKHIKSFLEIQNSLSEIYEWFSSVSDISLSDLPAEKSMHIIVDMINGFVKYGALSSKEVFSINNKLADFAEVCSNKNIKTIALADSHTAKSPEFDTFPVHCIEGTDESEVTDEIKNAANFILVKKNSTNGFIEPEFQKEIYGDNKNIFIVTGDCTDMCVMQLAMTLKCDLNRRNIKNRVIVPYELTATYDSQGHNAELCEIMALYIMNINGIEIVKNIIY